MLVLIDNYDSFTYNLYQLCRTFTPSVKVFRNDVITPNDISDLKPRGIIISPGPKAPHDAGICIDLIRRLSPSIPILGVCLGMQAIGAAFNAVVVRAKAPMHGKSSQIFHHGKGLYAGMPHPFMAGRYHSLVIDETTMPSVLIKESSTEDGVIMGVRHRHYPCYGVQFHPESILTQQGALLLSNFCRLTQ
jgi:anthranilate synthase component II